MATKILTQANFAYIWQTIKSTFAKKTDLDGYVAKVDGKSLTSNDFTDALKTKLDGVAAGAQVNTLEGIKVNGAVVNPTDKVVNIDLSAYATNTALDGKVDKVEGKTLTSNDYTDAEKAKLAGIAEGANVNVIEAVKVNGEAVTVEDKAVNIVTAVKVSELIQDIPYLKAADIANKVDKVEGKDLSTNDLTDELKAKYDKAVTDVADLQATGGEVNKINSVTVNGVAVAPDVNKNVAISVPTKVSALENDSKYLVAADIAGKVDKVEGKGLSANDFTDALKAKVDGIEEGARANVIETVKVDGVAVTVTDKAVDLDIAGTYATKTAVNNKVDKVEGKGLSTEDYTTAEKTKLAGITAGANPNVIESVKVNGTALTVTDKAVNVDLSDYATTQAVSDGYVAKETGKGLSANDFTDTLKTKLDGVAAGAEVNTIETIRVNGTASAPSNKVVDITVPTKISQITNDSGFQTAAEVTASIATAVADITSFDYQTVDTLPATGVKGTVYLVPATGGSGQNVKEEYIWIGTGYEMLGTTEMDLTGYWNETNLQLATNADIDAIINAE